MPDDKTFDQDEVNRIVTERLARQQAKFDTSVKDIAASAVTAFLAERGIDEEGVDRLVSANVDEKDAKIKQLSAQNKKLQVDFDKSSGLLKDASGRLDTRTKRDALTGVVGDKCTAEQKKVLWKLMGSELGVIKDEVIVLGTDGQPSGTSLKERVETVLGEYEFLTAPPQQKDRKPDSMPAFGGQQQQQKERIKVPYDTAAAGRTERIMARLKEAGFEEA